MTGKVEFRGKPIVDEELMESGESMKEYFGRTWDWTEKILNGIFTDDDFAIGQVIYGFDKAWIVGEVVDVGEEYIALEYWIPVDPKTVGQYIGLKDKNGVRIFEGDILTCGTEGFAICIEWSNGYKRYVAVVPSVHSVHVDLYKFIPALPCMVIGNRWDNPELLEV